MEDFERLVILNMVEGLGSIRTQHLLQYFGSLDKIFKAGQDELLKVKDIGPKIAANIIESIKHIDITSEISLIKKNKVNILTFLDKAYPASLKNIYSPPVVLYVKGNILPQDNIAISVVGSRLASFYGIETADRLSFELASRGITIVSGLARGIDSSAHKGALRAGGRTLAILGSGILNIYPEEHKALAERISGSGAIISEFPMAAIPDRGNFPKRNRIISGLSLGVVCVEAGEKSGALITCDIALEQNKEVFAVPGKIDSLTSKGTNKLIRQGAKLVANADDIIEELNLSDSVSRQHGGSRSRTEGKVSTEPILDKDESLVYTLLSGNPKYIDDICWESGIALNRIAKILLDMEIKKFVKQLPGKNFVKI